MSSTDDRIVKMQFDNAQFKKGASETKQSLSDVNKAVDAAGKSKGLLDLNSNMQKVQLTASKMSVVVASAIGTITNKAVNAGLNIAKSLTLDPLKQGFEEAGQLLTKQNVIMNATGKSAKAVKHYLNQLNTYSDKTIYSFSDMTDAITKFTNAGVPLGQAVKSVKGIGNAAAYAGANSAEAGRAMYAFSQSMSLGFVQLQDWNQIENANMGTVKFKNTMLDAAVAAGTLTKRGSEFITKSGKAITATKGWRDGLQDQWATTKVLNSALAKYSDTSTKFGRKALAAAQQVRTFGAFMDTLKESIGSGWASVFGALGGGLKAQTKTWTNLSQTIGGVVSSFFKYLTITAKVWRSMGGGAKIAEGLKNIFSPFVALLKAVGTAWQAAFPSSGGKGMGKTLYGLSAGFAALTSPLQLLAKLITGITPVLTIFFKVIATGGSALGGVIGDVKDFLAGIVGAMSFKAPSSGGFLGWIKSLAVGIGTATSQVASLIQKGKSLKDAFGSVKFKMPKLPNFSNLTSSLGSAGGKAGGAAGGFLSGLLAPLSGLDGTFKDIKSGFKTLGSDASTAAGNVQTAGGKMGEAIGKVWDWIQKIASKIDFKDVVSSFNLAILSTFMISLSRLFNMLAKSFEGFAGVGGNINEVLEQSKNALKSYQTQVRSKMILNIAIALGILAVALWVLSKIPADKLATSMAVLGGVFLMLNASMKNLTRMLESFDGWKTSANLLAASVGIVALAAAMVLLAVAFLIMNKVKWSSIVKGLVTMRVLIMSIAQLGELSQGAAKNMLAGAAAITIVAASMLLLAVALLAFKMVDWESMGKAGAALGGVALAVGLLALIPSASIAKVGVALLAASAGMLAMANALIIFGVVKWSAIGKAAVMLGLLTLALIGILLVGGDATISGLVLLAAAMVGLALAGLILNKVSWNSIAKIGAILLGLVVAVALFGVVLTVFLYAIAPVSPVLIVLAGAFALLGLGLLAFAAAMALAITLGAAGVAAFAALATGAAVAVAVFMQTLASEAPILKDSFLLILQSLIDTIVEAVPMIINGVKRLWAAIKKEISGDDKKKSMGDSGKSWIQNITDGIKSKMGDIVQKAGELIVSFLKGLRGRAKAIAQAAADLVIGLIQGLGSRAEDLTKAAVDLVIKLAEGLEKAQIKMIKAGMRLIAKFLHDLAGAIRSDSGAIGSGITDVLDAMKDVGVNMVKGLIKGVTSMTSEGLGAIGNLAGGMIDKAKSMFKIFSPSRVFRDIGAFLVQGLTNGIQNNATSAITAVASMVGGQIAVANEYISSFIQKLDQQAIAAKAKADGLRIAADKAAKAADKTKKNKKDDKAAKKLSKQADAAEKAATTAANKAEAAKVSQDRQAEFASSDYLKKAQMRSEDAQNQLDAAKGAEASAAKNLAAANALDKQSKKKGITPKERKDLQRQADALRAQAKADAIRANSLVNSAKSSAADALKYQKLSGDEAAKAFQAQFNAEKKAAEDAEKFDQMSDEEKAAQRRKEAEALNAKAAKDLANAKKLAYTDLEAANTLAQQAMDEAQQARQYINDAEGYEKTTVTGVGGNVINLTPTDTAAAGMDTGNTYDPAIGMSGTPPTIEFNQYNTSPEALNPLDVYRNTHNQLTFAADKIAEVSAA